MRNKMLSFLTLLICGSLLHGYQNSAPSLITPSNLYPGESEVNLAHRFYGKLKDEPLDTFFGMDNGANVQVSARACVWKSLELKAGYTRSGKQYDLGMSYRISPVDFPILAQLDWKYFSFVQPGISSRRENFLYLAAFQAAPWKDRLVLTLNTGYDGYYERSVNGLGMQIFATDKLSLIGEYYPVWDRDSATNIVKQYLGKHDAYCIAIKADTYGHHFIFSAGNSAGMDPRKQSLGADTRDLHLGFNIQRRLGS